MAAVLRVHGTNLDVDGVAASVPATMVQSVWRAGEVGRLGRLNTTPAITLLLSEAEKDEMVADAARALNELLPRIAEFFGESAAAEVDFAVFVGARQPCSIVLEPATLRAIERHGLRLVVSAYPAEETTPGGTDPGERIAQS
jgi:hypothetical protein